MTQLDEADLKSLAKVLQLIKFSLSRDAGQRRYCFIIGSGASVSSGIPTGAQLVDRWLEELYHQRASPEIRRQLSWQEWANEDTLSISGFSIAKRASFYGSIFKQTFQDDLGIGRGHLAQVMAGKVPSYGYSVLARVLGYTENKVVITTNFDHLLEESLGRFAYSDAKIIHDPYLSQYIGNYVTDPNPLVLKLHGDIYFNTYNTIDEITEFSEAWHDVFRDIFSKSTPIFIGYGGHDPGFMNSLANLKASSVQGAPIWFYRTTPPDNEHVRKFIANTNGQMIKSPDFDELMLLLGSVFDISTAEKQHEVEREIDRAAWMRNFEHVTQPIIKKVTATGADKSYQFVIREATMALLDTDRRDAWWNWHYKAQLATNKRKAARVYIEGLSSTNNNLILKACYQSFRIRSGMDKATAVEELISTQSNASDEYGEQSPETLTVQYQLARALEFVGTKSSYKEADRLYAGIVRQRQLQLSKKHPDTIAAMEAFGSYLCNTRRHQQGIDVLSEALECRVEANGEEHQLTKATRKSISLRSQHHEMRKKRVGRHRNAERLAVIHQPHFLPWAGYFNKIANCTDFISLDTVNFRQRYYQHRARLRNQDGKVHWGTLPLESRSIHQSLYDCRLVSTSWRAQLLEKIEAYYSKSQNFHHVYPPLAEIINASGLRLGKVNLSLIQWVSEFIDLPEVAYQEASDMEGTDDYRSMYASLAEKYDASDAKVARTIRVVSLLNSIGVSKILLGEGGSSAAHSLGILEENGIEVVWQDFRNNELSYKDHHGKFVSGLSIVDALFQEGRDRTRELVENPWCR